MLADINSLLWLMRCWLRALVQLRLCMAGHQRFAEEAHCTQAHIAALWRTVADQGLLTSSHERRALALQLFAALLPLAGCVPFSQRLAALIAE